jgi:hypothetical protein
VIPINGSPSPFAGRNVRDIWTTFLHDDLHYDLILVANLLKWNATRGELVQHHGKAVDIGRAGGALLNVELLWRAPAGVAGGAHAEQKTNENT